MYNLTMYNVQRIFAHVPHNLLLHSSHFLLHPLRGGAGRGVLSLYATVSITAGEGEDFVLGNEVEVAINRVL